ncbi:uncharacterized protein LOC106013018 [Aplysia californica]|uniref:Uncharacterized protein LOC106013018 n=1 Tax=Aplysia californica TaxID=6500 RepID=A0ABM1A8W5_APLCA|nr:uncharacterized protein LOC106013018 [Aplysia californica]
MEALLGVWKYNASTLGGDNDPMLRQTVIPGVTEEDYQKGGEVEMKKDGNKMILAIRAAGKPEVVQNMVVGEKQVLDGPGGQKIESEITVKEDHYLQVSTIAGVTINTKASIKDGKMFSEISSGGKTVTATFFR